MASELNMMTRDTTRQFNRSHGSFELAFAPVLMAVIGLWVDHRVGTTPLFIIVLAVFGFVGVGIKLFYAYRYEMAGHAEQLRDLRNGKIDHIVTDPGAVGR